MGNPHADLLGQGRRGDPARDGRAAVRNPSDVSREGQHLVRRSRRADRIKLRVWERGVGITLGCGSAACATLVAASRLGLTGRAARIELPGGELTIEWREADDHVLMTGPVEFEREIELTAGLFEAADAD